MLRIGDKTEEKSAGRKEKKNTDNGTRIIHTHDDEYGTQAGQGPLLRPLGNC